MWYSSCYNKQSGFGGGILPPPKKNKDKVATKPEVEQLKEEALIRSKVKTPENTTLQEKLNQLHTNGYFPVPASSMQGINKSPIILDQYDADTGPYGQGYDTNYM